MRVEPYGGLANRLRVVLSYRAAYGPIEVVWRPDGEIALAHFLDVFEPLSGVTFVSAQADVRTLDVCPVAPVGWQSGYRDLSLLPELGERFLDFRPPTPYGAMHVRRTDHKVDAKRLGNETPDAEFLSWLQTAPERVYLATDNGTTQLQYMKAIRESSRECFVYDGIHEHDRQDEGGVRSTTLAHAALDLFICAGADSFKGTRESSFSDAAMMLHTLTGWWS